VPEGFEGNVKGDSRATSPPDLGFALPATA
jgi:hypothetical protein